MEGIVLARTMTRCRSHTLPPSRTEGVMVSLGLLTIQTFNVGVLLADNSLPSIEEFLLVTSLTTRRSGVSMREIPASS